MARHRQVERRDIRWATLAFGGWGRRSPVGQLVYHVTDEALEGFVLHKLLINLGVVLQEVLHHLRKRLVVGHARGVGRVLLGILVRRVGGDFRGDVVADALSDPIRVCEQNAELLIERARNHIGLQIDWPVVAFGAWCLTTAILTRSASPVSPRSHSK